MQRPPLSAAFVVEVIEVIGRWRPMPFGEGFDRWTALLFQELLLGRPECRQVRSATETLDPIQEVIDDDPQALIFRRQLSDRAMQG